MEERPQKPLLSPGVWIALLSFEAALFLLGGGALVLLREGNFWAMWFPMVFMVFTYVAMMGVAVTQLIRRKRAKPISIDPPLVVPRSAVPGVLTIRSGDPLTESTMGWLWIDGSWLCFEGEHFRFRLQARDFRGTKPGNIWWGFSPLNLPGLPTYSLFFTPNFPKEETEGKPTEHFPTLLLKGFQERWEEWKIATPVEEPSVFPPLRWPNYRFATRFPVSFWMPGSIFMMFAFAMVLAAGPQRSTLAWVEWVSLGFALPPILCVFTYSYGALMRARAERMIAQPRSQTRRSSHVGESSDRDR